MRGPGLSVRFLLTITLVVSFAACGGETTSAGGEIEGPTWNLDAASVDALIGESVPEASPTARFEDGAVSGTAGCNQYNGTYTLGDDGAISIEVGSMTMMACEEPLLGLENAFVEALGTADSYLVDGNTLELGGDGPQLVFDAA